MVYEVLGAAGSPQVVSGGEVAAAPAAGPVVAPMRSLPDGVVGQLLRSAVALQAEGLLRAAGALSGIWGGVLDRTEWIERDARDLAALAAAASEAKVPLPAGVDAGAGDPDHPDSVVEGMLAGHEALVDVLRQLVTAGGDERTRPWLALINAILSRREEEMVLLRAIGAAGRLPQEESYVHGVPPRC
jgi:hypothetical protein